VVKKGDKDWWVEERAARERGFRVIAGIDEAGRGPLAGPVVAAAVLLPFGCEIRGVRDSKTMTPEQRERAYEGITNVAEGFGVGIVEATDVDRLNILRATHHAMRIAVEALPNRPDFVLIDGLPVHPFPVLQRALVKGDGRSISIAAASIIAKVTRDRIMADHDARYPEYGFARHKGYPTPDHLELLRNHGPCPLHRRTFAPVAELLARENLAEGATGLFPADGRRELGESGEIVACAHLRRLGWEVLTTRYHCREGEVDIIARDGPTHCFVEVKARRGRAAPAEAVDSRKRARLVAAAEAWLYEHELGEVDCRFDIVEVHFGSDGNARVNLLMAAFAAGE
jgi:ribonuclease HII